jgi:uncharacterized protein YxjI
MGEVASIGDKLAFQDPFEYIVKRGDRKIATFTRQRFRLGDTYFIAIDDNEPDQVLILALVVVIEVVVHRRHNW